MMPMTVAGRADVEEDWMLMLDDKASNADIDRLCALAKGPCQMVGHPDQGGVPFLEIRASEKELESLLDQDTEGRVQFIEPDPEVMVLDLDVPEYAGEEVEMEPTSTPVWSVRRVGGDTSTHKGKGVHIYVVDSGVRTTHRDFGGRAIPTLDMTQGSEPAGLECNGDTSCAGDTNGHGSHCAGTVGGETFGVAPQSIVHAMKISFDGLSTWSRTVAAFDWVASKGVRPAVVTASVGGEGTSQSLQRSIDQLTAGGILVLTSAGNRGNDACGYTPANVPNCMSIGATTGTDNIAVFSNWGSCVDLWAPGHEIFSAVHTSDTGRTLKAG